MNYQLLTDDNHTLYVKRHVLAQFEEYVPFINLQDIFSIIPIVIPTYEYKYMSFIFHVVENFRNSIIHFDMNYYTWYHEVTIQDIHVMLHDIFSKLTVAMKILYLFMHHCG